MQTQFKSIIQLFDHFKDEDTCRMYLENQRWNGNPTCPHCGAEKPYRTVRKRVNKSCQPVVTHGFKCSNKDCYKKFTVTVGTIFEDTKIPLRMWFGAIFLATAHKKGISSLQLSRDLNVTQKTAWFMLHRIREMLRDKSPEMLDEVVEVDETYVGGKEANKHKSKRTKGTQGRSVAKKTPVLGMMERGGNVVTRVVPNTKAETVTPIVKSNVTAGSVINTDEWSAYRGLAEDYFHHVVNHGQGEYVRDMFMHTNNIENFWSMLKRGIYGIYHQVSPKHLTRYCDEFAYRHNSRDIKDSDRFSVALTHTEGRLMYKHLIQKTQ